MARLYELIIDLSKYDCEKENFAHGANAFVSLYHLKDNPEEKIVIKKIKPDEFDAKVEKYFVREVSLMASLNHPCVIKLIGFLPPSESDPFYRICMPFLPNKNLMERLLLDRASDEKILTPTRRSIIIYGIASAMESLHLKDIVHRDLKPENVFLDKDFYPIVSDLGFSRIADTDLKMTVFLGTPFFMAPELWGDNKTTEKIDVYAYGISLLYMFTQDLRFKRVQPKKRAEFVQFIVKGYRYEIPNDVPEFYKSLIKRCWKQNPDERPSFNEIVRMFEESDEFILPDSNVEEVKKYINHLNQYVKDGQLTPLSNSFSTQPAETEEFDFI